MSLFSIVPWNQKSNQPEKLSKNTKEKEKEMKENVEDMKEKEQASNIRVMGFPGQGIKIIGSGEVT